MATLDLHFVNELIEVRENQHGGYPGAPEIINGHRVGASINRSCIVMLSALLQSFVEEAFQEASVEFLDIAEVGRVPYRKSFSRWGNPSDANIKSLFLRLGIADVLDELGWQRITNDRIRTNLQNLNHLRNQIAHGTRDLTLNGQRYSLSLAEVKRFRNFVWTFADRFPIHVRWVLQMDDE